MEMNRKTTLILGGTKGLGKKISLLHQTRGDKVYEVGRSADNRNNTDTLNQLFLGLNTVEQVLHFITGLDDLPPIDQFYWVAGRLLKGNLHEQTDADVITTVDVNFRNAVLIARGVWRRMMKDLDVPRTFCVVASSSGLKPRADEAIYVATKHAQVGFARSLGLESQRLNSGVKVSLIIPGGMQTPFWEKYPTPDFATFLDPAKVAAKIVETVAAQTDPFLELEIPRGSL
jgi:3-oxoacyl-[acyl-carrier protein] reductase